MLLALCAITKEQYTNILLLTPYIQVCFCLNMFQTGCMLYGYQFINTTCMPMGVANYIIIYDLIGQCYYTHIYMLAIISVEGFLHPYHYIPFPLQRYKMLAETLMPSTINTDDVFECLGIHAYAYNVV